jgi:hypothetical protein
LLHHLFYLFSRSFDAFIERFQGQVKHPVGIPNAQLDVLRPSLETLLKTPDGFRKAVEVHGYSTRELGKFMGVHQSTVVRRLQRASRLGSDPDLMR